ncbi:MAG: pyridoxal phosphate-dependent aminotransferase [Roseburia sp.]
MRQQHGGDIYQNKVNMDFSVNVNPLGMPESVKTALKEAVSDCMHYPDPEAWQLRQALADYAGVPAEWIVCGNGASELFLAAVHARKIRRAVVPVPSFYGYQHALAAVEAELVLFPLSREQDYTLTEGLCEVLTEDTDILFLADPNNPTGKKIQPAVLQEILKVCRKQNITVILDQCFAELSGQGSRIDRKITRYDNVVVVRAFTKLFAMAGVRLGYGICSNENLRSQIIRQLPEWNVSIPAQQAGIAACGEKDYVKASLSLIQEEREYLRRKLASMGMKAFPSDSSFLLFQSPVPLYESLLSRGILIRDCSNFQGLDQGNYYRIAVKTHQENRKLLETIAELIYG